MIVVSEIGEQWSPQTAPAMQAEMEIIISCGSVFLEHCNNDRDQDTKGSPAGSGGKGEERTDQEDDGRQERHQVSSCLADGTGNKIRSAEAVGHGL